MLGAIFGGLCEAGHRHIGTILKFTEKAPMSPMAT
jgi:hypothetical protein